MIKYISFRATCLVWLSFGAGARAPAADDDLLDALLEKRAITAEQHATLSQSRDREPATSRVNVSLHDGLEISSEEGDFSIGVGARLHADWARHTGEAAAAQPVNGTSLRRGRLELAGTFYDDWEWAAESDFADDDVAVKDFWLSYRGFERVRLTVGHQKQPYSLAVEMSSNDIPFVERSVDNFLILPFIDRAIGVRADASGERWFLATGLYGEAIAPDASGDEGWGATARVVFAPLLADDRVVHVGLRAARRHPSASTDVRIRDETTSFSDLRIVDTGAMQDVDTVTLVGPEAALAIGRFSAFTEYNRVSLNRRGAPTLDFDSWHLGGAWALGGESRAEAYEIEAGEFKALPLMEPFRHRNGGGAWELTARYASIDLNDADLVGGSEETFSVGANWYANRNIRFLLDWTRIVDSDRSSPVRVATEGMNIVTLRAQYAF
jgi:phosphate-selective porin OprO and OprP